MRTFQYRLYPNREQHSRLMACLQETRLLYNEMLERTKGEYDRTGQFLFKSDLNRLYAGLNNQYIPAATVQCLADRLDKALRRFFKRKAQDQRVGFPRFKPANRWHSIQLRQYGIGGNVRLEADGKHLRVPKKLGEHIKIKLHRPLEGTPKTAYLVYRADQHWYVLIVCETPAHQDIEQVHELSPDCAHMNIGLDVGLKAFVADSDGGIIETPKLFQRSLKTLRRKQRMLSRRSKGSHRRQKAARSVAKTHLRVARQRRDFLFKTAKPYAHRYRHIYVEDLSIEAMGHHPHLARHIHDASWGMFLVILADKAERAGHEVIRVPAQYTSQTCSRCGTLVRKSLSVRTHRCIHCGLTLDRDTNAALNILRAGAPPSGTVSNGKPDEPRSRCH